MSDGALTIGEAINLLQEEFPEVSVSKVRFLESQGLLRPTRSASGYRQFHQEDLARLRYILELQRDQYLPLKVIKAKLTMWERGEDPEGPDRSRRRQSSDGEQPIRIGFDELARRSGLSLEQLGQLVDHGLLDPTRRAWSPTSRSTWRCRRIGCSPRDSRRATSVRWA